MGIHHLIAGAREGEVLFADDAERSSFLEALRSAGEGRVLGYCLMDTHLHLVLESRGETALGEVRELVRGHVLRVNARRLRLGRLLRAPTHVVPVPDRPSLARALVYLHENPVKTRAPLVERPLDHVWSSQREFAGVSRVSVTNVGRARELLGSRASRVVRYAPPLADLQPSSLPTVAPEVILVAAAQVHGVDVASVVGRGRKPLVQAARRTFARIGCLEGYLQRHLAAPLDRTRSAISHLARRPVAREALRMTRTLLGEPGLRRVAERAANVWRARAAGVA